MHHAHPHTRRDAGQAATAILVTVALLLLGLSVMLFTRLARAEDQAGQLKAASDAAALAGAQAIVADLPTTIAASIKNSSALPGSLGQARASEFAHRNDAALIAYSYIPGSDEVRVTVRSNKVLISGKQETATSTAKLGLPLGTCKAAPLPTPAPTKPAPSTDPTDPTASPSPQPPVKTHYDCGSLEVPVTKPSGGGPVTITMSDAALRALFTPAISA